MDEHHIGIAAVLGGIIIKGIGLGLVLAVALPVKDGVTKLVTGSYQLAKESLKPAVAVAIDSELAGNK
jgi:hypothetical protein